MTHRTLRRPSGRRRAGAALVVALSLTAALPAGADPAPWDRLERASVSSSGTEGFSVRGGGNSSPSVSADGRFVVFASPLQGLVPEPSPGYGDVYLRDRLRGTTEKLSFRHDGKPLYRSAGQPSISGDGRYVAFVSDSNHVVPGTQNNGVNSYVLDRKRGKVERVSVASDGTVTDGAYSWSPQVSAHGRYVAFGFSGNRLVPGGPDGQDHIYVRDLRRGTTEWISVANDGGDGDPFTGVAWGHPPAISADGRFVAFATDAALVPEDTDGDHDVYVRDRRRGRTEWVTPGSNETSYAKAISADGRFVAFEEGSQSWAPGLFVRDRLLATTERVSVRSDGTEGPATGGGGTNGGDVGISADGRFVCFSWGPLVDGDTNNRSDAYVRDRAAATTTRLTTRADGTEAPADRYSGGADCSLSADGSVVAFDTSYAIVPDDTNETHDIYVRD